MINAKHALTGYISVGTIVEDVEVKVHYLRDTILVIELSNNQTLEIDISEYIDEITDSKIEAINNMTITVADGELVFDYDESVLDFSFNVENDNLIVDNNDENIDLTINENKELEVEY